MATPADKLGGHKGVPKWAVSGHVGPVRSDQQLAFDQPGTPGFDFVILATCVEHHRAMDMDTIDHVGATGRAGGGRKDNQHGRLGRAQALRPWRGAVDPVDGAWRLGVSCEALALLRLRPRLDLRSAQIAKDLLPCARRTGRVGRPMVAEHDSSCSDMGGCGQDRRHEEALVDLRAAALVGQDTAGLQLRDMRGVDHIAYGQDLDGGDLRLERCRGLHAHTLPLGTLQLHRAN